VAQLWLNCGGDLKALFGTKDERQVATEEESWRLDHLISDYEGLEKTGLFEFIGKPYSAGGFVDAVKKVREWNTWERTWLRCDIDRETLRAYTRFYFEGGVWPIREKDYMDHALGMILQTDAIPPTFLLSPEEFASILHTAKDECDSHCIFMDRLSLEVSAKIGKVRETGYRVKRQLLEKKLESAPDYIRESQLPPEQKFVLWGTDGPEEAKQEIAQMRRLPLDHPDDSNAVREWIRDFISQWEYKHEICLEYMEKSEHELAEEMAGKFTIHDPHNDVPAIQLLTDKLATLTKRELLFLVGYARYLDRLQSLTEAIRILG
jgi:hypothetical protein